MRIGSLCLGLLFVVSCGQNPSSSLDGHQMQQDFPMHADPRLTTGKLCKDPDDYRFPERIPYCKRSVSSRTKWEVIHEYDRLGFSIAQMNRKEFKIDHYLPLCLGGANGKENLWPQHRSVYTKTDPVEFKLCSLLQQGDLLQEEAIEWIKYAKTNLEEVDRLLAELEDYQ